MKSFLATFFLLSVACAHSSCREKTMNPINQALTELIESKTAAEEKSAAEKLNALVRQKHAPFGLTIHDAGTGELIPLNQRGADPKRSIYVKISAGSGSSSKEHRWEPKHLPTLDILLRE